MVSYFLDPQREQESVEQWLKNHEDFAEKFIENWLLTHPQSAKKLYSKYVHFLDAETLVPLMSPSSPKPSSPKRGKLNHFTSAPNLPISKRRRKSLYELRKLDKIDLFIELLTDVVSPDVNVNHLSHKILLNVLLLTNADRSSLFMVEGTDDSHILVSRLFDVTETTSVEDAIHDESEAIKMRMGVGIAGMVAKTGETINLEDAYKDERFNPAVDIDTGYQTKSILCMPIKTTDGQVIGVAQVINKNCGNDVFTKEDEDNFRMYLKFCAIGLTNSQLLDQTIAFSGKLKVLLHLAKGLFEDTTNLEVVIKKVMQHSMELIPCELCSVLLLENESKEEVLFQEFQIDRQSFCEKRYSSIKSLEPGEVMDKEITRHVATTATPVVLSNVGRKGSNQLSPQHLKLTEGTKSILCVPIINNDDQVLGVVKLTNKMNQASFSQADLESLEVFATFCGLGLHNVMMYEKISIANARNKVAFDVLAYHASSSIEETNKLMLYPVPEASLYHLGSFNFDDMPLSENHTVLASVRIFIDCGLVEAFKINIKVLYRWILTVKKNYRPVLYHNWRHAFNVAQTMFAMIKDGGMASKLTKLEQLALLVASLCHDLDHRGTNNAFQLKSCSVFAQLYTTSTMEHHHFDRCIMILNSEGNQILDGLSHSKHTKFMEYLESAILSTDLALYFKKRGSFQELVEKGEFDWKDGSEDDRDLIRGMLITACDVAAITKPWKIQKRVANLVASEFFEQGDLERKSLQVEPIAMMDRQKKDELPKMQVGFIDFICMPLYKLLADLVPELTPLLEGIEKNRKIWQTLADDPKAVIESESLPEIILPDVADESSHASLASTVTTATDDKIDTMNDTNGPIEGWCSSTNEENPNSKLDNVVGEDSKTGSLAGIVGKRRHLNLNTHC